MPLGCSDGETRGVCGVVAVAEDGRRIYYMSNVAIGDQGLDGMLNIYLYDERIGTSVAVASASPPGCCW